MSTIRYFDSIPHIVRYGMQDEEGGESWVLFWRNAVRFCVSVSLDDVQGTPFATRWLALNKEHVAGERVSRWVEQWNELCDCIITQCMPLLQTLAPPGRQWVTLEDHLRTPAYEIKMVTDKESSDAVATVTSGPVEKPTYEHHLMPFSRFQSLPGDLPRYQARDLVVLGQEKNWRHSPAKVRTPAGEVFYFMSCNRSAKNMNSGEISNASIEKINAYSRLHSVLETATDIRIPKLLGLVLSDAVPEREDWDAEGNTPANTGPVTEIRGPEPLLAGVLLSYLSSAKTLADITKAPAGEAGIDLPSDAREKWRVQVASAVQLLHDNGVAIGGRSDPSSPWCYINKHTIRIAPVRVGDGGNVDQTKLVDADAWLMVEATCTLSADGGDQSQEDGEKFEQIKAMDRDAVEKLFGP